MSRVNREESNQMLVGTSNYRWFGLLTKKRRARRCNLGVAFIALGSMCLLCGCTSVSSSIGSVFSGGCMSEAIELHRNRTCALKAWFRREHNFCDQPNLRDFKDGFVDGYVAIAEGKPGCPPSVPPKRFWSWAYQTPSGQSQMAAWYAGYPYGVQAAKDDGLNSHNHINLGPNFQTSQQNQNWNNHNNRPYSQFGDSINNNGMGTGNGAGGTTSPPLPNGSSSSILQDFNTQNSSSRQSEMYTDLNFSLQE